MQYRRAHGQKARVSFKTLRHAQSRLVKSSMARCRRTSAVTSHARAKESEKKDAVFLLEPGATLKNVIIGKNQMEGVHCDQHDCVLENVWWDDVCEDAFSVKSGTASSVTEIRGGGARHPDDKVIQHNSLGKVIIDGFFAQDFGKLYRLCVTCGAKTREVEVSNVYVVNPKSSVVAVNVDNNDKATLKNVYVESTKKNLKVCAKSYSTDGAEPTEAGSGADGKICIFEECDIHLNQKLSGSASNSTTAPSTTRTTVPSKRHPQRTTKAVTLTKLQSLSTMKAKLTPVLHQPRLAVAHADVAIELLSRARRLLNHFVSS